MLPIRVPIELARLVEVADPGVYGRAVELVIVLCESHRKFHACVDADAILIHILGGSVECYVLKHALPGRRANELFMVNVLVHNAPRAPVVETSYHGDAADAAHALISGIAKVAGQTFHASQYIH